MVKGVIQNEEILRHPWIICQGFGLFFYLRCLYHVLIDRHPCSLLDLLKIRK